MSVRLVVAGALALAALVTTADSSAQEYYSSTPRSHVRPDPHWAVEIRFGPYRPDVDQGVPGTTSCPAATQCVPGKPYDATFGDSKRIMLSFEVDYELLHVQRWLSIGVGAYVGYTKASGTAQFTDGSDGSAEPTDFTIWPFAALAVARLEGIANVLGIPFVPYAKLGPAIGFWSSSNGRGVSQHNGVEGRGHTGGFVYAGGVALQLDFLDQQAAKSFEAERGVKHTYAFGEYTVTDLHGLGQRTAMWLGDRTWNLGFLFEI